MTVLRRFLSFMGELARSAGDRVLAWPLWKKIAVATGILVMIITVVAFDVPPLITLRHWAEELGSSFVLLFTLAYILIIQLPIPRTVLTLTAGILFGPLAGVIISLLATTLAAALSLSIVRWLLGDWIQPYLNHPAVADINEHLNRRGWVAVLSLRLIPGIPFSIMNYASALTRVRLLPFTLASGVGSAPNTILVVFFGDSLTGDANPWIISAMILLAFIGIAGLSLDARSAVKSSR